MNTRETGLQGLIVIEPRVFEDERGYFFESYNYQRFQEVGIPIKFIQDNQSKSAYGIIRGLHMQKDPYAQSKLVRVLDGEIYDVAVDLRKDSLTFGNWFGIKLSSMNYLQLLVPKGFCHGFSVLSETAIVAYKCDEYYYPESETGIIYDDQTLNIDWKIPSKDVKVSEKDSLLPTFQSFK